MKNRVWIALLVVSLGVNIGFLVHRCWPGIIHGKAAGGWHAGPMRRNLGLSGEQTQKLEAERRQVLDQVKPLQDELRRKRRELLMLLKRQTVSDAELDPILGEISRLQAGIEKMFILHSLKVRGYFSPQQMHKFEGYLEQGLCPGLEPGSSCRPGKMSGRPGCADGQDERKVN
jgi:hypothetical protein